MCTTFLPPPFSFFSFPLFYFYSALRGRGNRRALSDTVWETGLPFHKSGLRRWRGAERIEEDSFFFFFFPLPFFLLLLPTHASRTRRPLSRIASVGKERVRYRNGFFFPSFFFSLFPISPMPDLVTHRLSTRQFRESVSASGALPRSRITSRIPPLFPLLSPSPPPVYSFDSWIPHRCQRMGGPISPPRGLLIGHLGSSSHESVFPPSLLFFFPFFPFFPSSFLPVGNRNWIRKPLPACFNTVEGLVPPASVWVLFFFFFFFPPFPPPFPFFPPLADPNPVPTFRTRHYNGAAAPRFFLFFSSLPPPPLFHCPLWFSNPLPIKQPINEDNQIAFPFPPSSLPFFPPSPCLP